MKQGETRIYTVPLRRGFVNKPKWKRTNAAVRELKHFIKRHSKMEPKIEEELNEFLWSRGNKNPPARVKIRIKIENGLAYANLETAEIRAGKKEVEEKEEKKEKPEKKKKAVKKKEKPAKKKKAVKKKAKKDYKSMTKGEIYEIAQKKDIEGRSTMNKSELIKAVKKAKK